MEDDTEAPSIDTQTIMYFENQGSDDVLGMVVATDNVEVTTFEITDGNDDGFFEIDEVGQITLSVAAVASAANDADTDPDDFVLTIQVSDAAGNMSSASVTLTVEADTEDPVIDSQTIMYFENQAQGNVLGTIAATDNVDVVMFEITAGDDSDFFVIDEMGRISLTEAGTESVANDADADPDTFDLTVEVSDAEGNTSTATVTLMVDPDDEAPMIDSQTITYTENQDEAAVLGTVAATDNNAITSFAIIDGDGDDLFDIDEMGRITFGSNGFTSPANDADDDPDTFDLIIEVMDGEGASATATVTITVEDDDEAPEIEDQTFTFAEGRGDGTVLGTVAATDDVGIVSFTITDGNDDGFFVIDGMGQITHSEAGLFSPANDFETAPNSFDLEVEVEDPEGNTSTATITLDMQNLDDEPPVITPDQAFTYDENQAAGNALGTVLASDDVAVTSFSIITSSDDPLAGLFQINAAGVISLTNSGAAAFPNDFDTGDNVFVLTISASDGAGAMVIGSVTLTVEDLDDEAPEIEAQSFSYLEDQSQGNVIGTVLATDNVGVTDLEIVGGTGETLFEIAADGQIRLSAAGETSAANDFDLAPNSFDVEVQATDAAGNMSTATITMMVTDVNTGPVATDDDLATDQFVPIFSFDPTANDTDLDGDMLTVNEPGLTTGGIALLNDDGTLAYAPRPDFTGTDSFDYVVMDPAGEMDTGTIDIEVSALAERIICARIVAYLYEATFDRFPDLPGVNFWIDALFGELPDQVDAFTKEEIAQFFLDSPEFELLIGDDVDNLTDEELIEQMFLNTLDRPSDQPGIDFWLAVLANDPNFSRADLLLAFAESPENQLGSPDISTLEEVSPSEWDFV